MADFNHNGFERSFLFYKSVILQLKVMKFTFSGGTIVRETIKSITWGMRTAGRLGQRKWGWQSTREGSFCLCWELVTISSIFWGMTIATGR